MCVYVYMGVCACVVICISPFITPVMPYTDLVFVLCYQ